MSDAATEVVVDATVVEPAPDSPGAMVVTTTAPVASTTLFRTDDPAEVIVRASGVADALRDVLKRQGLTTRIGPKDHVNVEGWQTCGAMLGVTPVKDWVRPLEWPADEFLTEPLRKSRDRGLVFGYEASYFAQTADGRRIGAAEAVCKRTESKWTTSDDYAIDSMAQTRATSKSLASVLRFIVTLAGYSGTPAEEMDGVAQPAPAKRTTINTEAYYEIVAKFQLASCTPQQFEAYIAETFGITAPDVALAVAKLTPEQSETAKAWLKGKS